MNQNHELSLKPSVLLLEEEFPAWKTTITNPDLLYSGVRIYYNTVQLQSDYLYVLLSESDGDSFPSNQYSYVSTFSLDGTANHLISPLSASETLNHLLHYFDYLHQMEQEINSLLHGSSLTTLCELGEKILQNPVCIHDDWFIMLAESEGIERFLPSEYVMASKKEFLPKAIINDFTNDTDYLETYKDHGAQLWEPHRGQPNCIYVNFWDKSVYRGRLIVIESVRPFKRIDFLLAEQLTQCAIFLLQQKQSGQDLIQSGMDDVVHNLLNGQQPNPSNLNQLLNTLKWKKNDLLLCIRLQTQDESNIVPISHSLHSDLFRHFPSSYILLSGNQQCILVNVSRNAFSSGMLHHVLSPICLEYCLYVGISSPVAGISELHIAYYQAGAALDRAFQIRDEKWIVDFSQCVPHHLISTLHASMQPWHIVSPELYTLIKYDKQNGTTYFDTFREYLLNERDIPKTSQKLIIHRTTLLYRLKKIQQIIRVNLEDPWERMYLLFSLWILEQGGPGPY